MTVKAFMPLLIKSNRIFWVNILILVLSVLFFVWTDASVRGRRVVSRDVSASAPVIFKVNTQREAYAIYAKLGMHGARVVHLNRFVNMVDYFPKEEALSAPFPLRVSDIRPAYEKGIDSHNWLFIANRTGLVRAVTSVLPDGAFRKMSEALSQDFAFTFSKEFFSGYTYDIPWAIATIGSLPVIEEPVVVNVDAGYFMEGDDPFVTVGELRKKYRNIKVLVLIASADEPDMTAKAKNDLERFEVAFKQTTPAPP